MDTVLEIEHAGRRVVVYDFSGAATKPEILRRIAEARAALARWPEGGLLTLTRCTDVFVDADVIQALGAFVAGNGPYVKAAAVVGAEGHLNEVRQLVAGLARRELEPFASEREALDWLVTQAAAP
jgi:hypothetical protein